MAGEGDTIEIAVLGELTATRGTGPVQLGGPQQRLVLASLVAAAPNPCSLDALQETIWGENQPPTARRTVQVYVSNLRKALGDPDIITSGFGGYALDRGKSVLDADLAATDLEAARHFMEADPGAARLRSASATERWRGRAFEGFRDVDELRPEISRLDELELQAREVWFEARFADGETSALLPDLERFCAEQPLRESSQALLMRVLHRVGRTAEALAAYRRVERRLSEELGIEPSSELKAVEEMVLTHSVPSGPAPVAERPTPTYLDAFVGREAELDEVRALLEENRLVTLLGPGGSGKTRLASEAVAVMPEPVTFVRLDGLQSDGDLLAYLAASVTTEPMVGVPVEEALAAALGGRPHLLVLDNCEHLVRAAAKLVESLLALVPNLSVLTTSRIALGHPNEAVYAIPALSLPGVDTPRTGDAVDLFVRRARTRNPRFELDDENEQPVADICRQLDGLPLALELAASRMDLLTPRQLRARLGAQWDLLADRRVEGRHGAMVPTLDWSLDLLAEDEELLLRRMSIFRGPVDLDAVEAVCAFGALDGADVLGLLGSLSDHSMLQVAPRPDQHMGYSLLVPLRELLEGRMGEAESIDLRQRHVAHVRASIEDDGAEDWPLIMSAMRNDLVHSLDIALDQGDLGSGLDIVLGLRTWWWLAGHREFGLRMTERLAAHLDELTPHDRAEAIHLRATALYHSQRLAECLALTDPFVALRRELGVPADLVAALNSRGILLFRMDRLDEAERDLDEASTIAAGAGLGISGDQTPRLVEQLISNRARVIGNAGRTGEALEILQPLMDLSRARGPGVMSALALYHQAELLRLHGDPRSAATTAEHAMTMAARLDLPHQEWSARHFYVHSLADLGEASRAAAAAESLVAEAPAVGEIAEALLAAGRVIADDRLAAFVLGATARAMDRSEVAERWARRTLEQALAGRRAGLSGDAFDAAFERGRATPGPAAIHLAADALAPMER